MDNLAKEELDRKIKIYEKLGALQFQKVVFKLEKIKFSIINKYFPSYIKFTDKILDFKARSRLRKAKTEDEKTKIKKLIRYSKMLNRRELNTLKNRNYHINNNDPTVIYDYLEWNKSIHKKGLITNIVSLPILVGLASLSVPYTIPFIALETFSAIVNFECINIQNYNICRYRKIEPLLEKRKQREVKNNIERYGKASEVIYNSVEKSDTKLPSIDEIVENITTKEQAEQMKELLEKIANERKVNSPGVTTYQFVKKKS